ncbi:MAG: transglutaminase-like cysteine peptidase [Candidatus Aminicenantes bacterium]|nr:transglutaminase-like cysteine peptidase [Candidatus Aminicenantes bacterium]
MNIFLIAVFLLLQSCATDPFDIPRADVPYPVSIVNDNINDIPAGSDENVWDKLDYWATPNEFYAKGAGDCEDYAIAKYFTLRKAGIPASKMFLALGFISDDITEGHMILLVTNNGTKYVLDNMVDGITKLSERPDFKILYSFNENTLLIENMRMSPGILPKWKALINRMTKEKNDE